MLINRKKLKKFIKILKFLLHLVLKCVIVSLLHIVKVESGRQSTLICCMLYVDAL
jgi:hypothetical protein